MVSLLIFLSASGPYIDDLADETIRTIAANVDVAFGSPHTSIMVYNMAVPSNNDLLLSLEEIGLPEKVYQEAFYSNEKDVPTKSREYGGRDFKLESNTVPYLPNFDPSGDMSVPLKNSNQLNEYPSSHRVWELANPPPSLREIEEWLLNAENTGATQNNLNPKSPSVNPSALSQVRDVCGIDCVYLC